MSDTFRGITFPYQKVAPADDAAVRRALLRDGILAGCDLSYSGFTLKMQPGYALACGRQFRHDAVEKWRMDGATSGYARLLLTIDMTEASTEDTFEQIQTTVEYASKVSNFPALIQEDLNNGGTTYQISVCVVKLSSNGISKVVSSWSSTGMRIYRKVLTLPADEWTEKAQTVAVDGLDPDYTVISTPAAGSQDAYVEYGVRASAQADGALTYTCEDVPDVDLMINVTYFAASESGSEGGTPPIVSTGGVSSWNDLLGRPFYEKTVDVEVLAEQDLAFEETYTEGLYMWQAAPASFELTAGEEYTVVWDGETYTCKAVAADLDGVDGVSIGNLAIAGLGDETGEPFLFGSALDGTVSVCFTAGIDGMYTAAIYRKTTVIVQLAEKFLPWDAIDDQIKALILESEISWYDITDKPFEIIAGGVTEIFSGQLTMSLMTNHTDTYQMNISPAPFVLTKFETYAVELDGSRHVLECATGLGSMPTIKHIVHDEDGNWQAGTFIIEYDSEVAGLEGGMVNLIVVGNEADHTLTIHRMGQIIKPLAAKFLPWDAIDDQIKALIQESEISWNDLTDKPFYEESGEVEILAEQTISGFASEDGAGVVESPQPIVAGETYTVSWDGEGYSCVAYAPPEALGAPDGTIGLGNKEYYDALGSGSSASFTEPFVVMYEPASVTGTVDMLTFVCVADGCESDTHTVSISCIATTIKTLDPKFLPEEVPATSIDLSSFESDGKIVETFADGTTKTTTIEFDDDGNPVKITDGDGNITELTW